MCALTIKTEDQFHGYYKAELKYGLILVNLDDFFKFFIGV